MKRLLRYCFRIEYILIGIAAMTFLLGIFFKSYAVKTFDRLDKKFIDLQKQPALLYTGGYNIRTGGRLRSLHAFR